MPARIVVVHDDPAFIESMKAKFGGDLAAFNDPTEALRALEKARDITFLVTRVQFADKQPVGLSLARLARAARPDVRTIFTGDDNHRSYTRGLGEFIPEPVQPIHVAMIIEWIDDRRE